MMSKDKLFEMIKKQDKEEEQEDDTDTMMVNP